MDNPVYIKHPSKVLEKYLVQAVEASAEEMRGFKYGMLGFALEVVTQIKNIESFRVITDEGRAEAVSALQTMLTDLGISDLTFEWYERLNDWRKPSFVAEPHVPVPGAISSADVQRARYLLEMAAAHVSAPEEHLDAPSPEGGIDALAVEHQPLGPASEAARESGIASSGDHEQPEP